MNPLTPILDLIFWHIDLSISVGKLIWYVIRLCSYHLLLVVLSNFHDQSSSSCISGKMVIQHFIRRLFSHNTSYHDRHDPMIWKFMLNKLQSSPALPNDTFCIILSFVKLWLNLQPKGSILGDLFEGLDSNKNRHMSGMQHPSWTFEKVIDNYCKTPAAGNLYLSSSELLE